MKIAILVCSDWESQIILELASRLLVSDDDQLSCILVGEKEVCNKNSNVFRELAKKLGRKVQTEEKEDRSDNSFQLRECSNSFEAVFSVVCELKPDLLIAGKHDSGKSEASQRVLVRELFEKVACRMLTLRCSSSVETEVTGSKLNNILFPTAGGLNATEAIKLVFRLTNSGSKATCLYVESPIGSLSKEVGNNILSGLLEKADLGDDSVLEKEVVVSSDISGTIIDRSTDFDLVIVGASNQSTLRQKLFGSIPDKILQSGKTDAVGVIRGPLPLFSKFRMTTERLLDLAVPQLSRQDRINLYTQVQRGAVWNFDFFALMALSTIIATLGLIQNSVAVIIGAMLVAPLMTPLLGAGLAIVQANTPLVRNALKAVAFGFVVSLIVSMLIALVAFSGELGSEIMARSRPTVIDMAIALFSGVAAAYCLARPGLSSALAGIAIAAALVPPVASTGIALAAGNTEVARGAALLFSTNVVSIILGASAAFFGIGIRDSENRGGQLKLTSVVFALLLILSVALLLPLITFLLQSG